MNGRRCDLGRTMSTKMILAAATAAFMCSRFTMVLAQQSSSSLSSNPDGCVTDYDESAGVDYFPDKAIIEYAGSFSVEYSPTYKVLKTYGNFSDLTQVTEVYVLYQCGTPMPSIDEEVQQYISVPVTSVSTGTTDHIPRIELLGQRDSLVAYTGATGAIGSTCVDALVGDGTVIQALTFDTDCGADVIDNAALINSSVEVAFGDSLYTSYSCANASLIHNGVAVYGYLETGEEVGLAHGEAIKLFSLFYNAEAKGNEIFDEIKTLMTCTRSNAAGCSLELSDSPTVAWFPYLPTDPSSPWDPAGSGWGAPAEDAYYTQAVEFAGGTPLYCGLFYLMSDEEMLECFGDADACVFAADYTLVETFFNETALSQLKCVQEERAYDFTLSGQNTWFEAIWVEPHVLVEDMVVVLHGDDFDFGIGSYERLLLRNVATEQSGTGNYYPDVGTCDDPDAVVELQGECELIVDFTDCESPAARALPTLVGFVVAAVAAAAGAGGSLWW